ncbi:unnamed protein product [Larinioides sclopetarius]|uniref:Uncharacterized protein n=1 Tax=Larinioides sclopetarius TaxID=280406 RepID=A0AAV2BMJ9_9ARAC
MVGALSSWKILCLAGNKVCILEWTWLAKTSLYFSAMILSFRVTIGKAEKHKTTAHIMTDPLPCLMVGKRQSRSSRAGVLLTCTRLVVEESVKDDSSDHILLSFFHQTMIGQVSLHGRCIIILENSMSGRK